MSWWPHEVQLPDRAEPEIRPTQTRDCSGSGGGGGQGQHQQQPAFVGRWVVCLVPAWFWFLVSGSGSCLLAHPVPVTGRQVTLYSCTPVLPWSGLVRFVPALFLPPCAHCCCQPAAATAWPCLDLAACFPSIKCPTPTHSHRPEASPVLTHHIMSGTHPFPSARLTCRSLCI